jgi:ABC-2 type transport system permease protein
MSWLPFSAPIIMPLRLTLVPISTIELTGSLTGLALSCLLAIWVAARVYRVGLLMYGKRPTLREVGRWVRQT